VFFQTNHTFFILSAKRGSMGFIFLWYASLSKRQLVWE
jgi:hypothetical protein